MYTGQFSFISPIKINFSFVEPGNDVRLNPLIKVYGKV